MVVNEEQFDQIMSRLDGLQAEMELRFATVATRDDLQRVLTVIRSDVRQQTQTTDITMVNHLRDIGSRFDAVESRLARLEAQQ
jgi:hypothetical protein